MVQLRNLQENDGDLIFEWISNPKLRKMTGTRGEPNRESHLRWLASKLVDQSNIIKIIEYENMPVGIIGTNEIDASNRCANIYLYIGDDTYRRKGIGAQALKQFIELLVSQYQCHKVVASIRSYNDPSIKLFQKCGFICEGIQKDQILYEGVFYDRLLFGMIVTAK